MIKSTDDERGQRDRGLLIDASQYDDDENYDEEWDDDDERYDDDDEPLGASMARLAAEIEAGHAEVPRGWKLDRPSPGVLVWTIRSGRRIRPAAGTGPTLNKSQSLMSQTSRDSA